MPGYQFVAHLGVTVLPFAHAVSDPIRVRHSIPVEAMRIPDGEAPVVAVVSMKGSNGALTVQTRLRRRSEGFYVEALGPRLEGLGEDAFAALVARAGTVGPQGPYTWGLNPFGFPPAHGPDSMPGLRDGHGPDGSLSAEVEANRIASTLISVEGRIYVRRPPPGWRVEDRGGSYVVSALVPTGRPDVAPLVSGRELGSYWVDVPADRRDVLDELLIGGRLVADGTAAARVGIPDPPSTTWTNDIGNLSLSPSTEVSDAIARLARASTGLEPSGSVAAKAWVALRGQAAGVPDVRLCTWLLGLLAERERPGVAPTLGTAAWMELSRLKAMGIAE